MIHISLYIFIRLFSFHVYLIFLYFCVSTINREDKGVWFLSNGKKNKGKKRLKKIFSICFNAIHLLFLIKPNKTITWPVMNREQYLKLNHFKWIIIILEHQLKLHVSISLGWNLTLAYVQLTLKCADQWI